MDQSVSNRCVHAIVEIYLLPESDPGGIHRRMRSGNSSILEQSRNHVYFCILVTNDSLMYRNVLLEKCSNCYCYNSVQMICMNPF